MGRPSTKPKKLKDGFYLEVKNQGAKSGIKIRRDTYDEMMLAKKNFERTKEVKVLGEVVDDTFVDDKKAKKKKKAKK
ncbi:MAG: hypothetical protein CMP59_09580 [Flavobacteriales bacterium]|nr:hypothetical protein [Flavobacteriales bacterium]|tara:strand:- start:179 stop:409 length:231 start_codon:yes stop_codon:yes gene_type:complete